MNTFFQTYSKRLNRRYLTHIGAKYGPFLHVLRSEIRPKNPKMIFAEMGCGAANVSRLIGSDVQHVLVDNDPKMLDLAAANMPAALFQTTLVEADIVNFELPFQVDVCHSHGVLEHFNDTDIRKVIVNQMRSSRSLIHYVPSDKYESPSLGGERLLSPAQWREICQPDELIEFNNGFDLILIWKRS